MVKDTNDIVVLLLAEHQTEFWMLVIRLLEFWSKDDHDPVLQEVIELSWVGI